MDALAVEGVEVGGEGGDQRFPLARLHLGDPAAVEDDAAEDLDVEVAHLEGPAGRFPDAGEGLDEDVVEGGALGELFLEFGGLGPQLVVRQGLDAGFELVDGDDDRADLFQVAVVLGPEDFTDEPLVHFLFINRTAPESQFGGVSGRGSSEGAG